MFDTSTFESDEAYVEFGWKHIRSGEETSIVYYDQHAELDDFKCWSIIYSLKSIICFVISDI